MELLGWRSPTCSYFYLSSRSLSWISYFQTDDASLLTAAPTFVVTPCSTMCHCGGKKRKVEMERNLIRTAVAPSSDTRTLFISSCRCVSLKEREAQFSVILTIRLIPPKQPSNWVMSNCLKSQFDYKFEILLGLFIIISIFSGAQ